MGRGSDQIAVEELGRVQVRRVVLFASLVALVATLLPTPADAATRGVTFDHGNPQEVDHLFSETGTVTGISGLASATVTYDTGGPPGPLPPLVIDASGNATFSLQHDYNVAGDHLVTVSVTDSLGTISGSVTVRVLAPLNPPPSPPPPAGGGGGSGGCGSTFYVAPTATITSGPPVAVWGQTVTLAGTLTGHPELNWFWSVDAGAQLIPAMPPGALVRTASAVYLTPGTHSIVLRTDSNTPDCTAVVSLQTVNVYGRNQYVSVSCGTPVFGQPTTLVATLVDLSPQPSAQTLAGRTVHFLVNGVDIGTGVTGQPTGTTATATLSTTFTLAPGGAYTCAGFAEQPLTPVNVYENAADPSQITHVVFPIMPPGTTVFPVGTIANANGTFTLPGGAIVQQNGTVAAGAPQPLVILSTPGKTEGEARCADGTKVEFAVRAVSGTAVKGELEYKSATLGFHASRFLGLGISADGRTATFMGTGQTSGRTPATVTFLVRVVDNGERGDTFQISFDGGKTFGAICGGEIQVRKAAY